MNASESLLKILLGTFLTFWNMMDNMYYGTIQPKVGIYMHNKESNLDNFHYRRKYTPF